MPQTDLIARLERMATTREWIAQQRSQEAHVSECEGLGTIAKIERQLSEEHAKVAADLRAAAAAVRLVGECREALLHAKEYGDTAHFRNKRNTILAAITEWEGKHV